MKKKNQKRLLISATCVLAIGCILFDLAYRYLIERVEGSIGGNEFTFAYDDRDSATYDDYSYLNENIKVKINKFSTGSGTDKITYFVADVKASNISYLKSAFAKDTFGRNITDTTSNIADENDVIFAINGDY